MGKIKAEELFLRERISKTLEEIKNLNVKKIDADIADIENYVPFEEIFFKAARGNEIKNKLRERQLELNLLITCVVEGIEYLSEKFLPQIKGQFDEEGYAEMEKLVNNIVSLADVEIDEETGDIC